MNQDCTQKNQLSQGDSGVLVVHKKRSETLAVLLERVRKDFGIAGNVPVTYAGRLDPMAEGVVILLTGEKCKEKDSYLSLSKTYEFTIMCGVSTDTLDVLGLITSTAFPSEITLDEIKLAMEHVKQKTSWQYPIYSSRTYNGVPLFSLARNNILPKQLPIHSGNIISLEHFGIEKKKLSTIIPLIIADCLKVEGDFRQEQIAKGWNELLEREGDQEVVFVNMKATVSSGVYIRSVCEEMGKQIGIPAIAYSINRISIGNYQ